MLKRIFLLSPASCSGKRAEILLRDQAAFDLAVRLRTPPGVSLAEAFSFLSGLYFRGKIIYARHFAQRKSDAIRVITTSRGLLSPDELVIREDLREFAATPLGLDEPRYREPLERDAAALAADLKKDGQAILLGSVATDKYVGILSAAFGNRLLFPADFVGRGDMSRGGLMLRTVDENRELTCIPVEGAIRRGVRPPKLAKRQSAVDR
jgi:hypothetical protein